MRDARAAIACAALAAVALIAVACGSTSRAAPSTPSPSATSEVKGETIRSTPTGGLNRWGYDPSKLTGQHDPPAEYRALPPGYRLETFAEGLKQPTALAFLPDGRMLVAEQTGRIRVVRNGQMQTKPFYIFDAYTPDTPEGFTEFGLVGLAVDPEFEAHPYVYAYYETKDPEQRTVLARIRVANGLAQGHEEIMSLDAAPACCHIAGGLRFAADGTLFVSVGDHQLEGEAQNRGSPYGAILRIDRDGEAPRDNPFVGVRGADPRVYAYGLRNAFDTAIDPLTGRVFASENGYTGQDAILELQPGANYGWPGYNLSIPLSRIAQPLLFYHDTIGPAGMEFYRGDALPELDGALLFCQFHRGGALHAVTFEDDGSVDDDAIIALGCHSDVRAGPDGFVYFLDIFGGTVYRIAAGR